MSCFDSIRWRLLTWNGALLAVVVTVLLVAFYRHERVNRMQMEDVRLRQTLIGVIPAFHVLVPGFNRPSVPDAGFRGPEEGPRGGPPGGGPPRGGPPVGRPAGDPGPPPGLSRGTADFSREVATLKGLENTSLWTAVISEEGLVEYRARNAPANLDDFVAESKKLTEITDYADERTLLVAGQRTLIHRHPDGHTIVIGASVGVLEAAMAKLALELAGVGVLIVGAGLGVGLFVVTRSLRPIARISATAERIASGDFSSRVDVSETESELGRLAIVLNGTFDALQAAREQIVRFTADASHELRTPLAVILANTGSTLKRERSPEEYRDALESAGRAAKRMKHLSDDLLELTRGGAGKEALRTMPCDFADIADEAVAMLTPLAKENGAVLAADFRSCPVTADPVRLGRVVVNLISNAILHNAPGVRVAVTARASDDLATLEVADDGRGIPEENLAKIFDRFHRADASRSRHTGGSGLGLAIAKQTVELHGGEITVESVAGKGTTMRVMLPLRKT